MFHVLNAVLAYLLACAAMSAGECISALGPCWKAMATPPPYLVTTSWYRYFRHPLYMFYVMQWELITLLSFPHYWWVPLVVFVPLHTYRAKKENSVLRRTFGAAYDTYVKGVWL